MPSADPAARTAFLVVDTESIPDGRLVAAVKYPQEELTPEEAVRRAREEFEDPKWNKSGFLPVTFQIPVAICVLRAAADFSLQSFACLDAPQFRTSEIVKQFWHGYAHYATESNAKLITFNGRGFDIPLLELAAFRYGYSLKQHYLDRDRYRGKELDLQEFFTNFGAYRVNGGLNLLAKLLGLPGKTSVKGEDVYPMYLEGKLQEINDYCLCDTLDTYFVFLRTRILTGDISCEREKELIGKAKELLEAKTQEFPVLRKYLDGWTSGDSL